MLKKKKIIQNLFLLGLCICIIVFGVMENNNQKTNNDIFVKELHICTNTHEFLQEKTIKHKIKIEKDFEYYACGYLLADSEIILDLYIISKEENRVVYSNSVNESFNPGMFFSKITLNSISDGEYYLEITKGRKTLSKFDFYIEN